MLKNWKFWVVMGAIGGLVVLFVVGFKQDPYTVQSPLINQPAPPWEITGLRGEGRMSLEALKGTPVVLNFWGSWCAACMEEAAVLQAAYEEFDQKKKMVRVVGIAMNDTPEKALEFAKRFGKKYPLGLDDKEGDIAISYGVYGAPETFFIDRLGIIRHKVIGAITPESIQKAIQKLAGQPGGDKP
ncbi:MAG: redoxin domain-containing protein [Deltaproteobacteria bacterium]|nr:redoxin domain-containing protein [Deltaproteobacteria bacterium]